MVPGTARSAGATFAQLDRWRVMSRQSQGLEVELPARSEVVEHRLNPDSLELAQLIAGNASYPLRIEARVTDQISMSIGAQATLSDFSAIRLEPQGDGEFI